jgi:tripartite-type tricarboxylate transporter receptor subunit TctC
MSGAKFQAVHYKGATPALTDVVAGHIQMMFVSVGTAVPQWRSSKVKLVAVSSPKRMERLPEVPTVSESGVPGYEAVSWFGLFGPAGMPADVVAKINAEIRAMHAEPEFAATFLDKYYFQSIAGSPEQLANFIKDEEPKWRKIITDANIKVK